MAAPDFETRWSPPLAFFERMASRYPFLMFVARVEHEDDESYPNGYFKVSPCVAPKTIAPPSSPVVSAEESDIAERTEKLSI